MKKLIVKEFKSDIPYSLKEAEKLLETQTNYQSIDVINWKEFPYKPEVRFAIGYIKNEIFLKYSHKMGLSNRSKSLLDIYLFPT